MNAFFKRLSADQAGATAVEYGLIIALIALAIIGALSSVSSSINGTMNTVSNHLTSSS